MQLGNDNFKFKSTTFVSIDYVEEELSYYLIALRVIIFPHQKYVLKLFLKTFLKPNKVVKMFTLPCFDPFYFVM